MKKPLHLSALVGCCLFSGTFLFAQEAFLCRAVVASAGGDAALSGKKFEYTLGEPVVQSTGNGERLLTQGFHQPENCPLTMTGVSEIAAASGLTVFPNPTAAVLHLRFDAPSGQKFTLQIINAAGQLCRTFSPTDDTLPCTIDCQTLAPGTYFLWAKKPDGDTFFQTPFVKTDL